jgi:hypothetical protein
MADASWRSVVTRCVRSSAPASVGLALAAVAALSLVACGKGEAPVARDAAPAIDAAPPPDAPPPPPVDAAGPPAPEPIKLVASGDSTCAVLVDHTVRCWGGNEHGQLGTGRTEDAKQPVAPAIRAVVDLQLASATACALLDDSSVACWGRIAWHGRAEDTLRPSGVLGVIGVKQIFVAPGRGCARVDDDSLVCWGNVNARGQFAAGAANRVPTPVVGLDHIAGMTPDGAFSDDGRLWRWGSDGIPRRVDAAGVQEIAARDGTLCARLGGGRVVCVDTGRCGASGGAGLAPGKSSELAATVGAASGQSKTGTAAGAKVGASEGARSGAVSGQSKPGAASASAKSGAASGAKSGAASAPSKAGTAAAGAKPGAAAGAKSGTASTQSKSGAAPAGAKSGAAAGAKPGAAAAPSKPGAAAGAKSGAVAGAKAGAASAPAKPGAAAGKPGAASTGAKSGAASAAPTAAKAAAPPAPRPGEAAQSTPYTSARQLAFDLGFCVITTTGRLQCGDGCRKLDPVVLERIDAVVGRCARLNAGTITCFDGATFVAAPGVQRATALAVGRAHACAITGGAIACWGDDTRGQLGDFAIAP